MKSLNQTQFIFFPRKNRLFNEYRLPSSPRLLVVPGIELDMLHSGHSPHPLSFLPGHIQPLIFGVGIFSWLCTQGSLRSALCRASAHLLYCLWPPSPFCFLSVVYCFLVHPAWSGVLLVISRPHRMPGSNPDWLHAGHSSCALPRTALS